MNVRLLRKIQKHILADPRRLYMEHWGGDARMYSLPESEKPPCGTVGCIAGWACVLSDMDFLDSYREAPALIGIEPFEPGRNDTAADRLFFLDKWPNQLETAYGKAKTPRGRARVAAKRIDHFIKTKGAE